MMIWNSIKIKLELISTDQGSLSFWCIKTDDIFTSWYLKYEQHCSYLEICFHKYEDVLNFPT